MDIQFVTLQLYGGGTIQLSEAQTEFLGWCNSHFKQLQAIKNSNGLECGSSNFTIHLKSNTPPQLPDVDHIDLHTSYKPI